MSGVASASGMVEMLKRHFGEEWFYLLREDLDSPYFLNILGHLRQRKSEGAIIYPESRDVFNAYKLTDYPRVRCVILGQDPYHDGHAHGLAFSTLHPIRVPPSLRNIFKEVENDIYDGLNIVESPDLTRWAEQGVFLLNTTLTVEKGNPNCHSNIGWKKFTSRTINLLNLHPHPLVFMLWGKEAHAYEGDIDISKHLVLKAAHPAAEVYKTNAGFFGCKHFSRCNDFLIKNGRSPVVW